MIKHNSKNNRNPPIAIYIKTSEEHGQIMHHIDGMGPHICIGQKVIFDGWSEYYTIHSTWRGLYQSLILDRPLSETVKEGAAIRWVPEFSVYYKEALRKESRKFGYKTSIPKE